METMAALFWDLLHALGETVVLCTAIIGLVAGVAAVERVLRR